MKKKLLFQTYVAIGLTLTIGFCIIIWMNEATFRKVSNESIENIGRLTSSNIYAEIDNDLTKPIYVSQTMANDTFLKHWLHNEEAHMGDMEYQQRLTEYLSAFREKYHYDSVFMVSAKSDTYYYFGGVNKIVSHSDAHDVWYYDFLRSEMLYDLDVDNDEAAENELTVFVNCRINAADGTLLGVVGVGVKMSQLQQLLQGFEDRFELQTFLINPQGDVQIHTDSSKIEQMNFFDSSTVSSYKDEILRNKEALTILWYPENQVDHCLITRYIDNLDWYLVVEKDTRGVVRTFQRLITKNVVVALLILMCILLLCIQLVRRHDRVIIKLATTDELTKLPNRKWFGDLLDRYKAKNGNNHSYLFIVDIDRFKTINDTKGHLFGDQILCEVSALLLETFGTNGIVARWGGDEFIGIFESTSVGIDEKYQYLQARLAEHNKAIGMEISVSFGVTDYHADVAFDDLLGKADAALYRAKQKNGNAIVYDNDIACCSKKE
ncbi:MAG: sensor domain-containing diguanylate cyclase [Clostridia bacterium]